MVGRDGIDLRGVHELDIEFARAEGQFSFAEHGLHLAELEGRVALGELGSLFHLVALTDFGELGPRGAMDLPDAIQRWRDGECLYGVQARPTPDGRVELTPEQLRAVLAQWTGHCTVVATTTPVQAPARSLLEAAAAVDDMGRTLPPGVETVLETYDDHFVTLKSRSRSALNSFVEGAIRRFFVEVCSDAWPPVPKTLVDEVIARYDGWRLLCRARDLDRRARWRPWRRPAAPPANGVRRDERGVTALLECRHGERLASSPSRAAPPGLWIRFQRLEREWTLEPLAAAAELAG